MAVTLRTQIRNKVIEVLTAAAPAGRTVKKGRKAPTNEKMLPMVQVYWQHDQTKAIGNPRRPMILQRSMTLVIKVTVAGDDDAFDAESNWIVAALWNAGNLGGLATNVSEAETVPFLEDSSENGALTAGVIHYVVEYPTLPGDLTAAN